MTRALTLDGDIPTTKPADEPGEDDPVLMPAVPLLLTRRPGEARARLELSDVVTYQQQQLDSLKDQITRRDRESHAHNGPAANAAIAMIESHRCSAETEDVLRQMLGLPRSARQE